MLLPLHDDQDPGRPRGIGRLAEQFERDAAFSQVFVVLTIGATLIATLGLLANSPGVVIGAMVVAPWILPLQAMAFEVMAGRLNRLLLALRTLLLGVVLCLLLAIGVGLLVPFPTYGSEVLNRTTPHLLDLGVALVAGAVAMYAKLRQEAISALAGLAIAVALVPPMCVVGLLLAAGEWTGAKGAVLLFVTNLLGILVGAMLTLAWLEKDSRRQLVGSRLGITSLVLTALLVLPLGSGFLRLLSQYRKEVTERKVEHAIEHSLQTRTITLGRDSHLEGITIDWSQTPPLIRARVSVTDPALPTAAQVAAVEAFINASEAPRRFRMLVQRTAVEVIAPEQESAASAPPAPAAPPAPSAPAPPSVLPAPSVPPAPSVGIP